MPAAVAFKKPLRRRGGPRCRSNSRLSAPLRRRGGAGRVAAATPASPGDGAGAGRVATATPAPPRPRRPGEAPPRRRAEEGRGRAPRLRRARGPAACVLLCGGGKMAAHGGSAASSALKGLIQQFTAITGEAHGSRGPPSSAEAAAAACLTGAYSPGPRRRARGAPAPAGRGREERAAA